MASNDACVIFSEDATVHIKKQFFADLSEELNCEDYEHEVEEETDIYLIIFESKWNVPKEILKKLMKKWFLI